MADKPIATPCHKRVWHALSQYLFVSVFCLLQVPGSSVFAQEPDANPQQQEPEATQPGLTNEEIKEEELNKTVADSVRLMFLEKESPLLHIRWGTRVYVDAPLGNEPAGADLTLRKAELKLSKAFGKNLQAKLSGNYLNGEFNAGDSYLVYTGWKKAILTTGAQSPPFSLESTSASSAISFMETALPVSALSKNRNAGVDFLRRTPVDFCLARAVAGFLSLTTYKHEDF